MQKYIRLAAIFALIAVVLGAFGAHALKNQLSEAQLLSYQTGIRYQFYHTLGILLLAVLQQQYPRISLDWPIRLMAAGIVLFSGSIYLLSCRNLFGIENWTWLGPITPIGGLCFIAAWGLVFLAFLKKVD